MHNTTNSELWIPEPDPWHSKAHGFIAHANAALARVSYASDERILDIACGAGTSTFRIAGCIGPGGEVVGVERSAAAVRRAESQRTSSGFDNVLFVQRNAEVDRLGGPYDHVFSFFGTMRFERQERLIRNVRDSMAPGGTYTQVVWRRISDNPWADRTFRAVRSIFGVSALPEHVEAAGVFSCADADLLAARLAHAGFGEILLERHDCDVRIGTHLTDAIDFVAGYGPASQLLALLGTEAAARGEEIYAALAGALLPFIRPDGVWVPSSAWLVGSTSSR